MLEILRLFKYADKVINAVENGWVVKSKILETPATLRTRRRRKKKLQCRKLTK